MTTESTYTLVERDHHGYAVNTITGLDRKLAETTKNVLQLGDVYQQAPTSSRAPWTCEIVRELTPDEQLAEQADAWIRGGGDHVGSAAQAAAFLRRAAACLDTLGDLEIPPALFEVCLHLTGHSSDDATRIAAVDRLAEAFGLTATMPGNGHYGTGYTSHGVRLVTIVAPPKPQAEADEEPHQPLTSTAVGQSDGGHQEKAAWSGEPGICGVRCACGEQFDGFDSVTEARVLLDGHIAQANAHTAVVGEAMAVSA